MVLPGGPNHALRVLGAFDAMAAGERLRVHRPAAVARLLAYLALHRGTPVSRTTLAITLWPDSDEAEGRANVRRHLHLLGAALAAQPASEAWLELTATTAALAPDAIAVLDVARFETAAREERFDDAADAYAGDLLPDWDDEWVIVARERLRTTALGAFDAAIARAQQSGDVARAIELAQRARSIDRWREETVRTLMGLQFLSGDRSAALRTFDVFARELRSDIGVDPMRETRQVYEAIRSGDGARTATRRLPARPSPPLPFAGRETELRALTESLEEAFAGRGSLVLLTGPAGIGKSRLLSEFETISARTGARTCVGTTSVVEATPYEAIVRALRNAGPLAAAAALDAPDRAALAALLPEFASGDVFGPYDAPRDALRLFDAVARLLKTLTVARPLIMFLDDLHFAGNATIAMLEALARRLAARPVIFVAAFRDGDGLRTAALRSLHRRIDRDATVARVVLAPLDAPAVAEIVGSLHGSAFDPRLPSVLVERSAGNPLFLAELLRDSGASLLVEQLLVFPDEVADSILARVASDPEDVPILSVAAVFGVAVGVDLLAAAVGLSEAVLREWLDGFVDRGILTPVGPRRAGDYAFTHQLLRDAMYDRVPESERRRLHARVAGVLIDASRDWDQRPSREIAYHLERAGDADAAGWYVLAARSALTVHALGDADELARAAGALTDDPEVCFAALTVRDDVARLTGAGDERAEVVAALEIMAGRLDDAARADAARRRADAAAAAGDAAAEAAAIDTLASLRGADTPERMYLVARLQARRALRLGDYAQAWEHAARAEELAAAACATAADAAELGAMQAEIAALRGDRAEAVVRTAAARDAAAAAGDPAALLRVLRMTQQVLFAQLRFEESIEAGQELAAEARRFGDVEMEAVAHARIAPAAARLFRVDLARTSFSRAAAIYRRIGNVQGLAAIAINEAVFLMHLGRSEDAAMRCEEAARAFLEIGDLRGRTVAALNQSVIDVRRGALEPAEKSARAALRLARRMRSEPMEAHALANLGGVARHRGDAVTAIAHLEPAIALRRRVGTDVDLVTDLTEYTLALTACGRADDARAACAELQAIVARTKDAAKDPQMALWSVAQTLHALGDEAGARRAIDDAVAALEERAAAIPDAASRSAFYAFSANPDILRAGAGDSDVFRTVSL